MKNNNIPWWAENLPDSDRLKSQQLKSKFVPIPSIANLVWFMVLILGLTSVGLSLYKIHPPAGRDIDFGGYEYYTDVTTINSQCTNIFVFGEATPGGIINLDDAKTPASFKAYEKYIAQVRESMARGGRDITATEEGKAFYAQYPIPRSVVSIPISGYMLPEGLDVDNNFVTPDVFIPVETVMRSMFDGAIIIWYNPSNETTVAAAKEYAESKAMSNLYVIPWNYPFSMPENKSIALSAWNTSINCAVWSEKAADGFIAFVNDHPEIKPKTAFPPLAPVSDVNGKLFQLDLLQNELE